jgi:hypothetical protein
MSHDEPLLKHVSSIVRFGCPMHSQAAKSIAHQWPSLVKGPCDHTLKQGGAWHEIA